MQTKRIKHNGKLKWREEYKGFTVYNFDTDDLFSVPKTAIDVFELADGEKTINDIISHLIQANNLKEVDRSRLLSYIQTLLNKKLLCLC